MEEGSYQISGSDVDGEVTIVAAGATRAAAVSAALNGLLAAASAGRDQPIEEATLAVPIRAEQPTMPLLVQALAARLAEESAEQVAPITTIRLDGLLRTDDGLTAWGYAYVAPGAGPPLTVPAVTTATVEETRGQIAITLTVIPASSELPT